MKFNNTRVQAKRKMSMIHCQQCGQIISDQAKIIIDEQPQFDKKTWFKPMAEVIIYYYVSLG